MMPYPATVPNTLPLVNFNQLVPRTNTNSIQSHNHYNSRISNHQYPTLPPHLQQHPVVLPQTPRSSSVQDGVMDC